MSQREKIAFDKLVLLLGNLTIDSNGGRCDLETGVRWLWNLGFINKDLVIEPNLINEKINNIVEPKNG